MKKFADYKHQALKDPLLKDAYDALEVEFQLIDQVLDQRIHRKLSQKQLAEKMGTQQSAISRLEAGNANPSVAFLKKMAKAFDCKLQIKFVS